MVQRILPADTDARAKRVGHYAENMNGQPCFIGIGHGLHRKSARSDDHVVLAAGDLFGDGVGGGQVVFRAEPLNPDVPAVDESLRRQAVEHATHAIVQRSIWEGSGNVMALDVLRAVMRTPAALEAFFAELSEAAGANASLDAFVASLRDQFTEGETLDGWPHDFSRSYTRFFMNRQFRPSRL